MFSKKISLGVCGLAIACSGAVHQPPVAQTTGLATCTGGNVQSDAELGRYGACNNISGDLRISNVSSLTPLSHVQSVGGISIARSPKLESLKGLERLESVVRLILIDDKNLDDVSQLGSLHSAADVALVKVPALRSLKGLSGLGEVDRLTVQETGLFTLHGLERLSRVAELRILNNPELIDVGSLNRLSDARDVTVTNNPRLSASFGFFEALNNTTEFTLTGNASLQHSVIARFEPASLTAPTAEVGSTFGLEP